VVILTAQAAFTDNNTGTAGSRSAKMAPDTVAGMLLPESPVSDNDRVYPHSRRLKIVAGDYFEVPVWRSDLDLRLRPPRSSRSRPAGMIDGIRIGARGVGDRWPPSSRPMVA
jgi:hypothetical protein